MCVVWALLGPVYTHQHATRAPNTPFHPPTPISTLQPRVWIPSHAFEEVSTPRHLYRPPTPVFDPSHVFCPRPTFRLPAMYFDPQPRISNPQRASRPTNTPYRPTSTSLPPLSGHRHPLHLPAPCYHPPAPHIDPPALLTSPLKPPAPPFGLPAPCSHLPACLLSHRHPLPAPIPHFRVTGTLFNPLSSHRDSLSTYQHFRNARTSNHTCVTASTGPRQRTQAQPPSSTDLRQQTHANAGPGQPTQANAGHQLPFWNHNHPFPSISSRFHSLAHPLALPKFTILTSMVFICHNP